MLQPAPMQFATLYVLREDAHMAALALAQTSSFEPVINNIAADALPEFPATSFRERFHSASNRMEKLLALCDLDCSISAAPAAHAVSEHDLAELDNWLGVVWGEFSLHQEALRHWEEQSKHYQALLKSLDAFAKLDIDLTLLRRNGRFLDLRVGSISSAEAGQLASALKLAGYVLQPYHEDTGQSHCLIAGPKGHEAEILRLLNSAGWHALEVPPEFSGRPDEVRTQLNISLGNASASHTQSSKQLAQSLEKHRTRLISAAHQLRHAAPHAEMSQLLRAQGGLSVISGWVPSDRVADLRDALAQLMPGRYLMTVREPAPEEMHSVPSLVRQARWLRPFAALVKNYGVPRYNEIDPTPLFAFSFIAMFGMMFGDIGHGAIIVAAGLLLRRLAFARSMLVAAGLSSMLFGWLYGSIFGFEEFIHPLWIAPLSDPARMLTAALYWGVGLILISTTLTIVNNFAQSRRDEALYSPKGVAGILFYLGLLHAAYRLSTGSGLGISGGIVLALPLGVVIYHLWSSSHGPLGERLLVVAVETLETALNYIANTLSFLRVAAFSMNHVALAIAVLALASMMGSTGHWITVVLGNIFSLVLEGSIVAIQVLRLEYYESFSRFYAGDGRAFRPLTLLAPGRQKS